LEQAQVEALVAGLSDEAGVHSELLHSAVAPLAVLLEHRFLHRRQPRHAPVDAGVELHPLCELRVLELADGLLQGQRPTAIKAGLQAGGQRALQVFLVLAEEPAVDLAEVVGGCEHEILADDGASADEGGRLGLELGAD
jgi:hypothetical protein